MHVYNGDEYAKLICKTTVSTHAVENMHTHTCTHVFIESDEHEFAIRIPCAVDNALRVLSDDWHLQHKYYYRRGKNMMTENF